MLNNTIIIVKPIFINTGSHIGEVTQSHGQLIILHNFKVIDIKVSER